jgi:hypothetical protein
MNISNLLDNYSRDSDSVQTGETTRWFPYPIDCYSGRSTQKTYNGIEICERRYPTTSA